MNFPKWRTLVIEDVEDSRNILIEALNESQEFIVVGYAESMPEGVELVQNTPAEVLFLDIKLRGGNAFELLNHLKYSNTPIPAVVITTGLEGDDYAQKVINEYNGLIIGYLKKPFWKDWEKNQERIIQAIYQKTKSERITKNNYSHEEMLNIPSRYSNYLVKLNDIVMVTTGKKGAGTSNVVLDKEVIICNLGLTKLIKEKLPLGFIQVSRYAAVNKMWISFVNATEKKVLLRNGLHCDISNDYYKSFIDALE